jgi:hypothetical protein
VELKVPTLMIEMPAAWHISELAKDMGGIEFAEPKIVERRKLYINGVINPFIHHYKNIKYIDLYDHVSYRSSLILENIKEPKVILERSPWHITQPCMDIIGEYFLKFINDQNYSLQNLVDQLKNNEYEI